MMRYTVCLVLLCTAVRVAGEDYAEGPPPGWAVLRAAGEASRVLHIQGVANGAVLEVRRGGAVGMGLKYADQPVLMFSASFGEWDLPAGCRVGIFVATDGGGLARLEVRRDGEQCKAQFAASAGAQPFGVREVVLPAAPVTLMLIRRVDQWRAEVHGADAVELASIVWAGLPTSGQFGISAMWRGEGGDAAPVKQLPVAEIAVVTPPFLLDQANAFVAAGDLDSASATLAEALSLFGELTILYQAQAWVAGLQGDYETEKAAWIRALKIDPADADALNALAWTMAEHNDRLDLAEKLVRKALQLTPDSPACLHTLGVIQQRTEREAAGRQTLARACTLHEQRGDALVATETAQAQAAYEQALALARKYGSADDRTRLTGKLAALTPPAE